MKQAGSQGCQLMVAEALVCTHGCPGLQNEGGGVPGTWGRVLWDLAERHGQGTFRPLRDPASCPVPTPVPLPVVLLSLSSRK